MTIAKTFVIGKVRPSFSGAWESTLTYNALDMVSYRGEAYMAVQDVPLNREPDVSADYWVKVGGKGDKGDTGTAGPQGVAGRDGAPGIQGIRGEKGDQGIQGIQGPNGPNGAPGIQGPRGVGPKHTWNGTTLSFENPDGTWSAPTDLKGPQGIQGPEGPIGSQGIQGPVGHQGPRGEIGPRGPAGPLPALSSAIDSASTVTAASSYAVKTINDTKAPMPCAPSSNLYPNSNNKIGEIQSIWGIGYGNPVYLPAGGKWMFFVYRVRKNVGLVPNFGPRTGVQAGGSLISVTTADETYNGFCWRIA